MEKFFFIKLAYAVVQFGLFVAILLLEIFLEFSDHINRWIVAVVAVLFSLVALFAACWERVGSWVPMLNRGYKLGITVLVAGGVDFGESVLEPRSILSFIIMGFSLLFIIVSSILEPKPKDIELGNYHANTTFENQEAFKMGSHDRQAPPLVVA